MCLHQKREAKKITKLQSYRNPHEIPACGYFVLTSNIRFKVTHEHSTQSDRMHGNLSATKWIQPSILIRLAKVTEVIKDTLAIE